MLHVTDQYRAALKLGADVVDISERLKFCPSIDDAEAALEFIRAKPENIGYDLRRLYGDDGYYLYGIAIAMHGNGPRRDSEELDRIIDQGWQSFDRERVATDRLLIDLIDDARAEGCELSAATLAELDRLTDLADANRAQKIADDDASYAVYLAERDAINVAEHAAQVACGSAMTLAEFKKSKAERYLYVTPTERAMRDLTKSSHKLADAQTEAATALAALKAPFVPEPAWILEQWAAMGIDVAAIESKSSERKIEALNSAIAKRAVAEREAAEAAQVASMVQAREKEMAEFEKPILAAAADLQAQVIAAVAKDASAPLQYIPSPTPFRYDRADLLASSATGEILPSDSHEALAQQFVSTFADKLRYVAAWGKWYEWTGQRWQQDDTLRAYDLARAICRAAAAESEAKIAKAIASAPTVAAVERMAKADRRIAAVTEQWDCDPWLLNTPNGVVDLRTGEIREARQSDYMTKMTAVAPGGECPTWLNFLHRVTGGDPELTMFLQTALGYGLTGVTREHALFFLYGTGANGKSVLLSTIAGIFGDYHTTAPIETFVASATERHPTDLAGLRGARLVTATETEEGRRWAESKIKVLTGGDKISARFMRQDFFEFTPQFKLMIAGNHRPGLRSVDEAIRRRIHLIPFTVTIPPAERDHALSEKLKAEWPGILAWLIEGCRIWQAQGLQPPQAVRSATAAYLDSEDALAAWLDERCERDPAAWTSRAQLFASWSAWATTAGEFAGSSRRFLSALETRGFEDARQDSLRGFRGLRLRQPEQPPFPSSRASGE